MMCLGDVAIQTVGARQLDHEMINKRWCQQPFDLPSFPPSLYFALFHNHGGELDALYTRPR